MNRARLTQQIKDKALELGFEAVGIAPATAIPKEHLRTWLSRQYHGQMAYMEKNCEKRVDPEKVLPHARSILSLGLNYLHHYSLPYDQPEKGVISRYASGTDYHQVVEGKLRRLLDFIHELEPQIQGKTYVDTGPVMDKYWAVQSGLGWLGKHTNVLSRELGSWFFIGEILLDRELDYDLPGQDFCGSCTRCIDACPTGAIVEPYLLDSRRCISYLTIELREDIPEQWRQPMGNLIYGCDICQDVCPWTNKTPLAQTEEFQPRNENQTPDLKELAAMSPDDFRDCYRGSAIKRAKWRGLMRNVAVALGNTRRSDMIPALKRLLASEEPLIRRHAAWGLKQIGTPAALAELREHQQKECDEKTRGVLQDLLSRSQIGASPHTSSAPS